jgi:putative NADH-flavin reductase
MKDHGVRCHRPPGRYILAEGLRRDHQLTAFTRWPAGLVGPSTLAAVAMNDGRDQHSVRKAIDGADAVISTVSAERRKGPNHVAEVSQ